MMVKQGIALCALMFYVHSAFAAITVRDGIGDTVTLPHRAKRIISLAPNLTEMLFALGAGKEVVAVSRSSNYPARAKKLPRVNTYNDLNLEAIMALHPQLVVAWQSGNPWGQLQRLKQLGIPVYIAKFRRISDITNTMKKLAILSGTTQNGRKMVDAFYQKMQYLRKKYQGQAPVRVFYQVWQAPLFTLSKKSVINQAIKLCGGRNVFANTLGMAPEVSIEGVIAANPQVIIAGEQATDWRKIWRAWPQISAVKNNQLYQISPDLIERFGPRFIEGTERLCQDIAQARLVLAKHHTGDS